MKSETIKLVVTCLPGLEKILEEEIVQLGAKNTEIRKRAVACIGTLETVYKLNLQCRFALRVLVHIEHHKVETEDQMYRAMHSIYWHKYFSVDRSIALRSSFGRHSFKNTHYFTLKAKDAVVDRFTKEVGRRPSVDTKSPEVVIHTHFSAGHLDVYLDSSGYSLHKRGYKRFVGRASLNETLAAALCRWGEWDPTRTMINPMCGVGTLAIESCYLINRMSPQLNRRHFGYKYWYDFDNPLHERLLMNERRQAVHSVQCSDNYNRAVRECRENIFQAKLRNTISCEQIDFFKLEPVDGALILLNPPYDMRMRQADIGAMYKRIGDTLKFNWKNCRCVLVSANLEALKFIGLKPHKKYKVFNGPLPAEVRVYDVY